MIEKVLLGFQGWAHPQWIERWDSPPGGSYDMLEHYSRQFPTVEVDDTFYGVPPEPVVRRWRESVSPEFLFSFKAPQQITHEQRFSGPSGLLRRFLDRVSMLDANLGPILLLAPPGFEPDETSRAMLRSFVRDLPGDFNWALELRNDAWFTEELHDLLAGKNIAMVVAENRWVRRAAILELAKRPTADFAYFRWNGLVSASLPAEDAASQQQVTAAWANTLEGLSSLVRSVYGYFSVNACGNGTRSIEEIRSRIGQ